MNRDKVDWHKILLVYCSARLWVIRWACRRKECRGSASALAGAECVNIGFFSVAGW